MAQFTGGLIVMIFGALVATGELVSRYRDQPSNAFKLAPGRFYIGVNAVESIGALVMVRGYGWTFGQSGGAVQITQILVAGFGSIALFRSSLFTVRVGSTDVGIGPSAVLDSILAAADRAIDRQLAVERSEWVIELTKDATRIDPVKAIAQLPPYCLALMQNLSSADQDTLGKDVAVIATQNISPSEKVSLLLLSLRDMIGPDVVKQAFEALRPEIQATP
ncbi:MAG: hypothetical protein HKL80_08070 [Acidimicrobiales bacterium]|nr:hypothetical protein [Acidimicrobiales bacterium]